MKKRSFLPPFGKIFITSFVLFLIGGSGLAYVVFMMEPRLGPRWMMYFFLTVGSVGFALPILYLIQRRIATSYVDASILMREAIFFSVFLDLILWMQIGRILNNLIIFFLAAGLIFLEVFLRITEKAAFDASELGK